MVQNYNLTTIFQKKLNLRPELNGALFVIAMLPNFFW